MKKTLLGLATHWPIVYMALFMCVWLASFFLMQTNSEWIFGIFAVIFPLHALTMLLCFGLLGYYIWHTINNKALSDNERIVWLLVNLMGGMMGWPFYFWTRIAPSTDET